MKIPERMLDMKAAVVYGINDMRLEEVPIPNVPEGSIRIKVKYCAICGTDRRIYKVGDFRASYPVITGHEISAVVEAVAPGIATIKEGDRVCVAPGHGCGLCKACREGYPNVCTNPHPSLGYKLNGGFAEYMAVPEHIFRLGFVNRIPESLSYKQACMSEIIACCINAQNNAPIYEGDTVLIIGAGPAGLIHANLAKLKGAGSVILTQRSSFRLLKAKELFPEIIDHIIPSSETDLESTVMELTGGLGADAVFVCAPAKEAQEAALHLAATRGRVNFFGGLPKDNRFVTVDANNLHYKELFISGASSSLPAGNIEALNLLAARKIDPDQLITHTFMLADIDKGFDIMESRNCIKVAIQID